MAGNPIVTGASNRRPQPNRNVNNFPLNFSPSTSQSLNINNRPTFNQINATINSNTEVSDDVFALLKCPICSQTMEMPIYMCKSGHNVCHMCIKKSNSPVCQICNNDMTTQRNFALEKLSLKVGVRCPNHKHGCTLVANRETIAQHVEYCQYLSYDCPVKKYNTLCAWEGNISCLEEHFKANHLNYMVMKPGDQIIFKKINLNNHDSNIQLFTFNNLLFLYNICIDVYNKMASWTIQYIGCDKNASDWIYEIHIYNSKEPWRKVMVSEACMPYSVDPDTIFSRGRCASIPLQVMKSYLNENGDFTFKFYMKERMIRR